MGALVSEAAVGTLCLAGAGVFPDNGIIRLGAVNVMVEDNYMKGVVSCPICSMECTGAQKVNGKDVVEYDYLRCGDYSIIGVATITLENSGMNRKDRAKVAASLRERTLCGDPRIRIQSQQVPEIRLCSDSLFRLVQMFL